MPSSGLAFGIGLGARGRLPRVCWRTRGRAVGAIAYDLIGPAVFPLANTAQIVSETWASRLVARLVVSVMAAAGAAFAASEPREPPGFPTS